MSCSKANQEKVDMAVSHSVKGQGEKCGKKKDDSEKDGKSCASNCEQSCCSCSATSSSSAFNLVAETIFKNSNFNYLVDKETQFSYVSRAISDGFLSIWLIPKIG